MQENRSCMRNYGEETKRTSANKLIIKAYKRMNNEKRHPIMRKIVAKKKRGQRERVQATRAIRLW